MTTDDFAGVAVSGVRLDERVGVCRGAARDATEGP
jgi:hypothetical protein